jgi:hypothetical protein
MIILHPQEIERLISCRKVIDTPPRKDPVLSNRSYRNNFTARSVDGDEQFSVFLRQSDDLPDNFTIGLLYTNHDGAEYMLFRCNGPHGDVEYDDIGNALHFEYHTHLLKTGYRRMVAQKTVEYGSYQDAISFFMKRCNILEAEKYFGFVSSTGQLEFGI